jgi:hypothetical protein
MTAKAAFEFLERSPRASKPRRRGKKLPRIPAP